MPHIEIRDVSLVYDTPAGRVTGVQSASFAIVLGVRAVGVVVVVGGCLLDVAAERIRVRQVLDAVPAAG